MPIFELQGPDGAIYEVDAPDERAAVAGFQQLGSTPSAQPPAAPAGPAAPLGPEIGVATAGGRGAAQGLTLGLYDELRGLSEAGGTAPDQPISLFDMARGGYRMLTGAGGDGYQAGTKRVRDELAAAIKQQPVATMAGEIGGALGSGLGLAGSGLSFGANAVRGGAGLGRAAVGSAADGAILGGLQGAASAEEGQRIGGGTTGLVAGGALGAAAPLAVAGISNSFRRAVSPLTMNAERQVAADVLRREGVDLTAGQMTGSGGLRYAEGEIGGSAAENVMERQGEQFTAAALRRAGANANRATPDVIDDAFTRVGQQFDDLAARNRITPDQQMARDLQAAVTNYEQLVPDAMRAPIVRGVGEDILAAMRRGSISGESYQALRSRLERAARSAARDPELSQTLRGMRETLDDAMERSITAANPADAGAWREVRNQYRNLLTVEKAATGAGENAALGLISPSALRNATVQQGRRAYARGQGDFSELARAGEALLKPLPQSGTAPRLRAQNLGASLVPTVAGAGAGGAYGAKEGGLSGAIAGAIMGAAAPRAAGALMMSRPGQAYLSNQLLAGQMSPQARAIANLLLTNAGVAANPAIP